MSQAGQSQWRWDPQSQRYYYYDERDDALVFQNGQRVPRPQHIPRTSFASTSAQAAATPSPSNYASHPIPSNPGYVATNPGQQYYQPSVRPDAHHGPTAAASRGQVPYQDPARASSSQVDALAQNLGGMTVSTQHTQPGSGRHPQPVIPQVRIGSGGQRIVETADPNTNLRTIIQTAPVTAITDPALLQSGIYATSRLLPAEHDVTERLFKSFRLRDQPRKFFTVGKVFLVLWVEPAGESNTVVTGLEVGTTYGRFGERAFSKVRRFVVVREGDNYCSALPITSYGHRGVGKPGVNKSEHSIIHTSKTPQAPLAAELPTRGEDGMRDQAIRVDTDDPIDKLESLSRLDYGKVHTIQHNIKVKSFGKVNPKSMYALINQFGNVWRALPSAGPAPVPRAQEDDEPAAPVHKSTAAARRPSQVSARAAPAAGPTAALQARSPPERAASDADRAAMLQADVRAAVQALVRQGHTEQEAERAIREELARRRARQRAAQEDDDDDDDDDEDDGGDEDSDEEEGASGAQAAGAGTQGQQSSSSQGRSGSTQQSSTRTPAASQGTSSRSQGQTHGQARSTGASASSQAQMQANQTQVNAYMTRLLQEGRSQEEALTMVRARFSSGRRA